MILYYVARNDNIVSYNLYDKYYGDFIELIISQILMYVGRKDQKECIFSKK